jgi:sugar lactone lactonase YvrE
MTNKIASPIQMMISPGPKPNGLQASKEGLWVIDQGDSKVHLLDWSNGKILKEIQTDTDRSSGITIDNEGNIWIASTYNCKIYKINQESGKTIEIYDSPGAGINATRESIESSEKTGDHGLEWKNGNLYIASPPSQYIHEMDPKNWVELNRTKVPGFRVHGIAWAEEEGTIWAADTAMGIVSRIRLSDSRIYDVFRVPDAVEVHGMTIKDNVLWYCDDRRPIGTLIVDMNPDF